MANYEYLKFNSSTVVREKIVKFRDGYRVTYDSSHWKMLQEMRERARKIIRALPVRAYVHGSLARGDITKKSDIDIVILENIPSYLVESYVDYEKRLIMQATPNSAIKAVYVIDPVVSITFPLTPLNERELQFYDFGGKSTLEDKRRVRGINKKLLFIEPTEDGHMEWSVIGREYECAKMLGIDIETVMERVRVLSRRDKIGRTGVYLKEEVPQNKSVEEYLKNLADRDPVIRRVVRER